MGSLFARPPARAALDELAGHARWRSTPAASARSRELELSPPAVLCLGAERDGLPAELRAARRVRIPVAGDRVAQRGDGRDHRPLRGRT